MSDDKKTLKLPSRGGVAKNIVFELALANNYLARIADAMDYLVKTLKEEKENV